jgi:hypothetical protein
MLRVKKINEILYDLPKPANEVEKERFNPSTYKITLTWEALNGIVKEKESNLNS